MMFFKFTLVVAVCLQGVWSACDQKTVENIKKLWNNKPPTNILSKYDGIWTVVKMSSKDTGVHADLKCLMEVSHGSQAYSKDYWYFGDSTKDYTIDIKQTESNGAIVEKYKLDNKDFEDSMYVLFFEDGVMGFWTCSNEVGMSGILVKDYAKTENDPKTKAAILKAEESFKKAELPPVQGIHTVCPADPTKKSK